MHESGIRYNSVIVLNFNSMNITVQLDKETFQVTVDPDNKVRTIKDAIQEIKGVEAHKFQLKLGSTLLKDAVSIFDAKIKEGSTVIADLKEIDVQVDLADTLYNITIDPNKKVYDLRYQVYIKTGYKVHVNRFILTKAGAELDDQKSIYESGIRNNTRMVANMKNIDITIKLDGKTFSTEVDPDNKVKTIKEAI
jgi:copper chaperone CopZ